MKRNPKRVEIFESLEEENEADRRRRAGMSPEECLRELVTLQERYWGKDARSKPIEKVATWEKVDW